MDFNNALFFMKNSRRVRRKGWEPNKSLAILNVVENNVLIKNFYVYIKDEIQEKITLSTEDILASDWELQDIKNVSRETL